jgi:hypothetical protein
MLLYLSPAPLTPSSSPSPLTPPPPLSRGAGRDDAGVSWADPVLSSVEGTELTALGEMVRVCGREEAERLLKTFRVEVR